VAREDAREKSVAEWILERPLEGERVPAPDDRADLTAVFPPQRGHARHRADGALDGDRPQALLAREQGRREVPTDLLRQDAQMERRPHGVETPGRPRDPGNARLEPADPHLVAHVPAFGLVGLYVQTSPAHVMP